MDKRKRDDISVCFLILAVFTWTPSRISQTLSHAKRQRNLLNPDGFIPTKVTPTPHIRISAPQFQSDFASETKHTLVPVQSGLSTRAHQGCQPHTLPMAAVQNLTKDILQPLPSSSKPRRRISPPPFPNSSLVIYSTTKPLKPISATRIALATDIRSEGGAAEVLGLFVQQHGTGYVSIDDRELARGLDFSPHKNVAAGRRKTKYLRCVNMNMYLCSGLIGS